MRILELDYRKGDNALDVVEVDIKIRFIAELKGLVIFVFCSLE